MQQSDSRHPTKETSTARYAQLERLKLERKAKREALRMTRVPKPRHSSYVAVGLIDGQQSPTYPQLIREIQRIAMGSVAPSMALFDYAKPATWPCAAQLCETFGLSWSELATEAGLILRRQHDTDET